MSLIKAIDVPKHMADRMRSRRLAARLSGSAAKPPVFGELDEKKPVKAPAAASL
jgi:hypothetical protein